LIRNSYGTGDNGRKANDESNSMRYGTGVAGSAALAQARGMLKAMPTSKKGDNQKKFEAPSSRSRLYGEADQKADIDAEKLKKALEKEQKASLQNNHDLNDRKRKYNSMNAEVDVTEEEMEAYRLRKERSDDPMAKLGSGELLDYK